LGYFSPLNIAILLIDLAMAWHVIRSGRSPMWIMGMGLVSFFSIYPLLALWLAYLDTSVVPEPSHWLPVPLIHRMASDRCLPSRRHPSHPASTAPNHRPSELKPSAMRPR